MIQIAPLVFGAPIHQFRNTLQPNQDSTSILSIRDNLLRTVDKHFPTSRRPESHTSNKNRHPALMSRVIRHGNTTDCFNPIYPMNKFVCNITTDELFSVACIFPGVGIDSFLLFYGRVSDNRACRLDREGDELRRVERSGFPPCADTVY